MMLCLDSKVCVACKRRSAFVLDFEIGFSERELVGQVLRNYSVFLLHAGRLSEAEQYLRMALALCDDDGGTLNGIERNEI